YHLTRCAACSELAPESTGRRCPSCGQSKLVQGDTNRLAAIADRSAPSRPAHRPPYIHQVPLEFNPKPGPKTLNRLLDRYQTEMNALHHASREELAEVVSPSLADAIITNRRGETRIEEGGGGRYGRVLS